MTDTDQEKEDAVLKRLLQTPPKPHEPVKKGQTDDVTAKSGRPSK